MLFLLLTAATSINQHQRETCIQNLNDQYRAHTQSFMTQIFNLLCSYEKTHHIIAYSYFKKLLRQHKNERFLDCNQRFQSSFYFWYDLFLNQNQNKTTCQMQTQNIIELNGFYLSLNTSRRLRQQFVNKTTYNFIQSFNKSYHEGNKNQVLRNLIYCTRTLKQLAKYKVGTINSKILNLDGVLKHYNPQTTSQAEILMKFLIVYSNFTCWVPNKDLLINIFTLQNISKQTKNQFMQYIASNFKIMWNLQDQCRILYKLNQIMSSCLSQISLYTCQQVSTILKCLKQFLHNFFIMQKIITNVSQALIIQKIYSYEQFQKILRFITCTVDHFKQNNQIQAIGNISQQIVQYSTQILRLYFGYLKQNQLQSFVKRFLSLNPNDSTFYKSLVLLSVLPKYLLQIFQFRRVFDYILKGEYLINTKNQIIFLNFLINYINNYQYLQPQQINKLCQFFINLIKLKQTPTKLNPNLSIQNIVEQVVQQKSNKIESICYILYGLSKVSKYKCLDSGQQSRYFTYITQKIFNHLLQSSNQFSLLIEALQQLIKRNHIQWNITICNYITNALLQIQNGLKQNRLQFYQMEIQLYRLMKKSINIKCMFLQLKPKLNSLLRIQNQSNPVIEEILYLIQQVLFQFNLLTPKQQQVELISEYNFIIQQFFNLFITKQVFIQVQKILSITNQQNIANQPGMRQNKLIKFQKISFSHQQYTIGENNSTEQLRICCIRLLLQLCIYKRYLQTILQILITYSSQDLYILWQAICIIYPNIINSAVVPYHVNFRLDKIKNGNLLQLLQNMNINQKKQWKNNKEIPSWAQLYKGFLRQNSIINTIVQKNIDQNI